MVPVNPTYHEVINDFAKRWEKEQSERYLEYRKKWANNPKNFVLEDGPLHLDIEPTNACDLKCPMCPRTLLLADQDKSKKFKIGNMPIDTYKRIIDEAVEIGVYSVKLNYMGEPLVHPQIVDMVKYAKDKGIVDVMFNTNANLLNEDLSKKLIEAGLDKIFFSFDSPIKEKYEEIRVGANFDKTLANIKYMVALRNELGLISPLTRVSMVLMEDNKADFDEFVKLFRDIVDIVAYVEYQNPVREKKTQINEGFACSQLWQRMFILWDGDVIPCCNDEERQCLMGNIHQNSIKEIWNNEKYVQTREKHRTGRYYDIEICSTCNLPLNSHDGNI